HAASGRVCSAQQAPHYAVCFPEGNTAPNQLIRDVRCDERLVVHCVCERLLIEAELRDGLTRRRQQSEERIERGEQQALVLLQVLVVATGHGLHHGERRRQLTDQAARHSARELEPVRI